MIAALYVWLVSFNDCKVPEVKNYRIFRSYEVAREFWHKLERDHWKWSLNKDGTKSQVFCGMHFERLTLE